MPDDLYTPDRKAEIEEYARMWQAWGAKSYGYMQHALSIGDTRTALIAQDMHAEDHLRAAHWLSQLIGEGRS